MSKNKLIAIIFGGLVLLISVFIIYFSNNTLINVCKDNKWGYINLKNKLIIPFEYDYSTTFENGLAIVCKNSKCCVIKNKNKTAKAKNAFAVLFK